MPRVLACCEQSESPDLLVDLYPVLPSLTVDAKQSDLFLLCFVFVCCTCICVDHFSTVKPQAAHFMLGAQSGKYHVIPTIGTYHSSISSFNFQSCHVGQHTDSNI